MGRQFAWLIGRRRALHSFHHRLGTYLLLFPRYMYMAPKLESPSNQLGSMINCTQPSHLPHCPVCIQAAGCHTRTHTHTHASHTHTFLPSFCFAAAMRPRNPHEVGGSKKTQSYLGGRSMKLCETVFSRVFVRNCAISHIHAE